MLTAGRDDGEGRAGVELKSSGKRSVHLVRIWNMIMLVLSNKCFAHISPVHLLVTRLSHRLQSRGQLRGHAQQFLMLRPQLLVVLEEAGVLVPQDVELGGTLGPVLGLVLRCSHATVHQHDLDQDTLLTQISQRLNIITNITPQSPRPTLLEINFL